MDSQFRKFGKHVDDMVYRTTLNLVGARDVTYSRLARRYEHWGWWEQAADAYRTAIRFNPQSAFYHAKRGLALLRVEAFTEAEKEAQEALTLEPGLAIAHFLQGRLHHIGGRLPAAVDCFRKAVHYRISDASAYQTMAAVFAQAEAFEESAAAYKEIIRISPKNVAAYGAMAATYAKLQKYPEALEAYKRAVEIKPTADAYSILGAAYANQNRYKESVWAYQQALKLEPGLGQTYNRLVQIYVQLEDFERRTQRLSGQTGSLGALVDTDEAYARLKKEQAALERFKDRIRRWPNDHKAYASLAEMYLQLNIPSQALEFIKHAQRIDKTQAKYHRIAASALLALNQKDGAARAMKDATRLDPHNADTHALRARAYLRDGKCKAALEAFQEALRQRPQDADLHAGIGETYQKMGKLQEASRAYWEAIHIKPQEPRWRYHLGVLYVQLDKRSYAQEQKAVLKTLDAAMAEKLGQLIWKRTSLIRRDNRDG